VTPVYFGDCFGWIHPAEGGRGVVVCSAFGLEDLCTHRFMRHLADELAHAGLPTLRFDYQGTGDSLGTDLDPDRVQHWLASIRQAITLLQETFGVQEVALVGFRLGALLAAEVARQLQTIPMLALLGSPTSGKSYVREMKALGMLIAQSTRVNTQIPAQEGAIEVAGFRFTAATIAELQQLDLLKLPDKPADKILLMGRPHSSNDDRLLTHFRSLGCSAEHQVLPGYAELEWNSSFAEMPEGAFASLAQWLRQNAPAAINPPTSLNSTTLTAPEWQETAVRFGPEQNLFGVHCRPASPQNRKLLLFVNHGSNHHIGWARLHVSLARRMARVGIASLRMDISGVGDSPAHPGRPENLLYARHSQLDVHAAIDWLKNEGYETITLIGHCAGAYLGFYSTLRDARVTNLVMLNLQRFFWARGESLAAASEQSFRSSSWYWSALRDPQVLRRLITAKVNISGIAMKLAQRTLQRGYAALMPVLGPLLGHEGPSQKVVRWLRELSNRGTHVLLVYSAEDGGLDEIAKHAGSNARKIRQLSNVHYHILEGADHNLTQLPAQEQYAKMLEEFLLAN
jgi:pimeloyl-ACP methyl ester carboxylesterase